MFALSDHNRPRIALTVTAAILFDVVDEARRRLRPDRKVEKMALIEGLIEAEAWTDAALALIDLELPQWQVRRIAFDDGEWYCALSRQRELPDWLDRSIEARHADLPLAILSAIAEAKAVSSPASRISGPLVPRNAMPHYEPVCCENFG